jgi:hypothetical protein
LPIYKNYKHVRKKYTQWISSGELGRVPIFGSRHDKIVYKSLTGHIIGSQLLPLAAWPVCKMLERCPLRGANIPNNVPEYFSKTC